MQIMENSKSDKVQRVLALYTKLINGGMIDKTAEAQKYSVAERSIQRDIEDIRTYVEGNGVNGGPDTIVYDRSVRVYKLASNNK